MSYASTSNVVLDIPLDISHAWSCVAFTWERNTTHGWAPFHFMVTVVCIRITIHTRVRTLNNAYIHTQHLSHTHTCFFPASPSFVLCLRVLQHKECFFVGRAFFKLQTVSLQMETKRFELYSHSAKHRRGYITCNISLKRDVRSFLL